MVKRTLSQEELQAYIENETDANKKMSIVDAIAAGVALVLWVLYLVKFFTVPDVMLPIVCILFPVVAVILLIPLTLVKTPLIKKPQYKFLLLFGFLLVAMAINVTLPKHGVLGWTIAIAMASHYYNPKFARVIFFTTLVIMLVSLYLGMFFGEYDPLLLGLGVVDENGSPTTVNTPEARLELINNLMAEGNNRYAKVFFMYYLPRATIVSLLFIILNSLNRRTNKLLNEEIRIHSEQGKVKAELNVAKNIQVDTLPTEKIDDGNIEIFGEIATAKEVGGDLYDYFNIDDNHAAVLIGDVSGKGIPAAMFMMKTITSFRDFTKANMKPSEILRAINSSIMRGNKTGMFVTCFLLIIDKRNGKIVYSNAGHNPPIIGKGNEYRYLKPDSGLILGVFDDPLLIDEEITIKPDENIVLYTDGVTEARNKEGGFFGERRLLEALNDHDTSSSVSLHDAIRDAVMGYVKDATQSDDVTLVTLKYKKK